MCFNYSNEEMTAAMVSEGSPMSAMDKVLSLPQCMDMIIEADDKRDSWRCIEAVRLIFLIFDLVVSISHFLIILKI